MLCWLMQGISGLNSPYDTGIGHRGYVGPARPTSKSMFRPSIPMLYPQTSLPPPAQATSPQPPRGPTCGRNANIAPAFSRVPNTGSKNGEKGGGANGKIGDSIARRARCADALSSDMHDPNVSPWEWHRGALWDAWCTPVMYRPSSSSTIARVYRAVPVKSVVCRRSAISASASSSKAGEVTGSAHGTRQSNAWKGCSRGN